MHNPLFYERHRMRASTFNIPRFLKSYDETLDGGLILPRGMLVTVTDLAAQAGSRLDITDERTPGTTQQFTLTATLKPPQRAAATELARSRPARTPGKGSTALRWTPFSSPRPSPRRDGSSSTPAASSALTTARPPPRYTTTTTSSLASSPHPWPSAHPATPASAPPTRLPRPATAAIHTQRECGDHDPI